MAVACGGGQPDGSAVAAASAADGMADGTDGATAGDGAAAVDGAVADAGDADASAAADAAADGATDSAAADSSADASCGPCDDAKPCTADSCVAGSCQHAPLSDAPGAAQPCDDGAPCTADDRCVAGACVGKPLRWQATFGGADEDAAHDAVALADGGAFVVGHTRSKGGGGRDAFLLRVDRFGALMYDVALGDELDQTALGAHRVGDQGLLVGAWRHHGDPRPRGFYQAVTLASGATVGAYVFALADASELHAVRAGAGQTGGVRTIAAGYVEDDDGDLRLVAARIDPITHAPLWIAHHGDTGFDVAWDAAVVPEGGFALLGDTGPGGLGPHVWLLRLDDAGKLTWQRSYFQDGEDSGWGLALHTDPALQLTGFAVAGRRKAAGAAAGLGWLMKADAAGNLVWQQTFPSPGGAVAYDVAVVEGGHIAVGSAQPQQGAGAATLWRGDGKGDLLWTAAGAATTEAQAALVHNDGFGLAGRQGSGAAADVWLARTGKKGELSCP